MGILDELEQHLQLGPVATAKAIGHPYSTYAQYKNGQRSLRPYTLKHIKAVLLLSADQLQQYLAEGENIG